MSNDSDSNNSSDESDSLNVIEDSEEESESETESEPAEKRSKISSEILFKNKVLEVLRKVVTEEFAACGKLENAPSVVISVKNSVDEFIKFPLSTHEVVGIMKSFSHFPLGNGSETSARNSLQLDPEQFEIVNPDWKSYIKDVLESRIRAGMSLECPFILCLHKLILYTPGSFLKPHQHSEKGDGMFATLVIQLPSKYEGGQLIVRHNEKTQTIDFSSSKSANCSFSTFYSVFYNDCDLEMLPVTDGCRVYLVYKLFKHTNYYIPIAAQNHILQNKLKELIVNWEGQRKLVYVLKHHYSSSLSFESLTSTDKAVASMLNNIAEAADLIVYLATFEKKRSGYGFIDNNQCDDNDSNHHTNCDCFNVDFYTDRDVYIPEHHRIYYKLTNLVSIVATQKLYCSMLNVNFNKEVIPDDCFDSVKPYKKVCDQYDDIIDLTKHYRNAAIVFWPKRFMVQVLTRSGARVKVVESIFLKEVKKHFEAEKKAKQKLLEWAKTITNSKRLLQRSYPIPLINAIVQFNDEELIKDVFRTIDPSNSDIFTLLIEQCEKYGWNPLSSAIVDMFKNSTTAVAIGHLNSLIGKGHLTEDKKKVCIEVFQIILDKRDKLYTPRIYGQLSHQELIEKTKVEGNAVKSLLTSIEKFENLELVKNMFRRIVPVQSATIPLLVIECEKYGWEAFGASILEMFGKHCRKSSVESLNFLIDYGNNGQKKLFQSIFQQILEKKSVSCSTTSCNYCDYSASKDEAALENEIWQLLFFVAEKIGFKLLEHVKAKSFEDFVPVLLKLTPKASKKFNTFWMTIAKHFIIEMEKVSVKSLKQPIWRREAKLNCRCDGCTAINDFLRSDEEMKCFLIEKENSYHIQCQIRSIEKICERHEYGSISKVCKLAEEAVLDEFRIVELSRNLLRKLKSVMSANC